MRHLSNGLQIVVKGDLVSGALADDTPTDVALNCSCENFTLRTYMHSCILVHDLKAWCVTN